MGYLFAIITSVFFTAYVVPKKLTDQPPIRYSLFQGMGFFAASALTYLISIFLPAPSDGNIADRIDSPVLLISLAAGVVWFSASMSFLRRYRGRAGHEKAAGKRHKNFCVRPDAEQRSDGRTGGSGLHVSDQRVPGL